MFNISILQIIHDQICFTILQEINIIYPNHYFTVIICKSNQVRCWFLMSGENRSIYGKTSLEQNGEPTNPVHIWHRVWKLNPVATLVEGKCSHHQANRATKLFKVGECYSVDKSLFIGCRVLPKPVKEIVCSPDIKTNPLPPPTQKKHSKDFLRCQVEEKNNFSFLFHQCHLNVQDNTSHSSYNSIRCYQNCIGEVWTEGKLYVS